MNTITKNWNKAVNGAVNITDTRTSFIIVLSICAAAVITTLAS